MTHKSSRSAWNFNLSLLLSKQNFFGKDQVPDVFKNDLDINEDVTESASPGARLLLFHYSSLVSHNFFVFRNGCLTIQLSMTISNGYR